MKQTNIFLGFAFTLFAFAPVAFAQVDVGATVSGEVMVNAVGQAANATATTKVKAGTESTTSSSQPVAKATTTAAVQGETMSTTYRSAVANFVLGLNKIADRDRGIGAEVRAVAQAQATSSVKIAESMEKIEQRNGVKTFLIGTDYKNIGTLRSEIVTTQNSTDRLIKAREKTRDTSIKSELDVQIKALQDDQVKVNTFIKVNEDKLNLLGWFVKIFQK